MKRMTGWTCTGLTALTLAAAPLMAEVKNTSYTAADGSRVLRHEGVVEAPVADVWKAFTTTEGVTSWMVPSAALEFGIGEEGPVDWRKKAAEALESVEGAGR